MNPSQQMPPWMFILDGTFLGFLDSDRIQTTYLTLDVEQEQMDIQLPQELRRSSLDWLRPGDQIRCIGQSQLDFHSKTLKLSAYQVLSLT